MTNEYKITMKNESGDIVGEVDYSGKSIKFTGNFEASAKIFFNCVRGFMEEDSGESWKNEGGG